MKGDGRVEIYANKNGTSNIYAFEIFDDFINVLFNGSPKVYTYSYRIAGKEHVENMKNLAKCGYGLNGYINRYVKYQYDRYS